jgi:hypothetical protein
MTTISLTLTVAANGAGMTLDVLITEFVAQQGARYANDFKVGIITGAAFIRRLSTQEYAGIITAAESSSEIAGLVEQFTEQPIIALDDKRLIAGLQQLVEIGLLTQERKAELLLYQRPQPL